jgi:hypothetical protein
MELFDLPPQPGQRLDEETHAAVFGDLPSALARSLRTPEIGDLVLQLLDAGWRRGQLAARIGALPAGPDPTGQIHALLAGFLDQVPPDARWQQEKADREQVVAPAAFEEPATEESRQAWLSQIRADLGVRKGPARAPLRRVRPPCSICGVESSYFVTKDVRLCDGCVERLSTGAQHLPDVG